MGQEDFPGKKIVTLSNILPGKSHGQRSLMGYSLQSCKESDTTECLSKTCETRKASD